MKFDHLGSARCMFIDGPVMLSICEAPAEEIRAAIDRLRRVAYVAARMMESEEEPESKGEPT